jgi:hypothetical protein
MRRHEHADNDMAAQESNIRISLPIGKSSLGRDQHAVARRAQRRPARHRRRVGPPGRHVRARRSRTAHPTGADRCYPRLPPRHRPRRDRPARRRLGPDPTWARSTTQNRRVGRPHPAGSASVTASPARTAFCSRSTYPPSKTSTQSSTQSSTSSCSTAKPTGPSSWPPPYHHALPQPDSDEREH